MKNERNILQITATSKASKEIIVNTILSILRIINISNTGITIQLNASSPICSNILAQLALHADMSEIKYACLEEFSLQSDIFSNAFYNSEQSDTHKKQLIEYVEHPSFIEEKTPKELKVNSVSKMPNCKEDVIPKDSNTYQNPVCNNSISNQPNNSSKISIKKTLNNSLSTPSSTQFNDKDVEQLLSLFEKGWILDINEISEVLEIPKNETSKIVQLLLSQGKIKEAGLNTYKKGTPDFFVPYIDVFSYPEYTKILDFIFSRSSFGIDELNKKFQNQHIKTVISSLNNKYIFKKSSFLIANYSVSPVGRVKYTIKNNPGITLESLKKFTNMKDSELEKAIQVALDNKELNLDGTQCYLTTQM